MFSASFKNSGLHDDSNDMFSVSNISSNQQYHLLEAIPDIEALFEVISGAAAARL
jgi:hypothetical protein